MGTPTGLTRFIYPEFPPKLRSYGWNGKGRFLLKVNPKTGDVDEVKVLKRTGQVLFDEFSANAFFQWKFQSGAVAQVRCQLSFIRAVTHGISIKIDSGSVNPAHC